MRWLIPLLAACGNDVRDPAAPLDGPRPDVKRTVICERAGVSTVTGFGPAGPLDGAKVYAHVLNGFCGNLLVLTITHDDPFLHPQRPDNAEILASIPELGGPAPEWSGTFPASIEYPDESSRSTGTLEVQRATRSSTEPSFVRATARFTGIWELTATVDVPYCKITTCL